MKLSRTANLLHNEYDFPRPLARLIGGFVGTDISFLPGHTFFHVSQLTRPQNRMVGKSYVFDFPNGTAIFEGTWIREFIVEGITACYATIRCIQEFRFYAYWRLRLDPIMTVRRFKVKHDSGPTIQRGIRFCMENYAPYYLKAMQCAVPINTFDGLVFNLSNRNIIATF